MWAGHLLRRRLVRLLAALLALAAPAGSAATVVTVRASPATVAAVPGHVIGVAQDADSIAWLEAAGSGCWLRVQSLASGTVRTVRYAAGCLPADLALAGGRAAWGGYQDVRCSETYASVYTNDNSRGRLVQNIPGDCLGYRTSFQGLTSDGNSFFYSLLVTSAPAASSTCGNGGPCRWQLASGRIVRIAGTRPVTARGLPPAALIAAANGRIALVEPARSAASGGQSFDWPRAARNGRVEIRNTGTAALVTSFSPQGTVRAVALSASRAVVLVEAGDAFRIEWYDSDSGARLGAAPVPRSTAPWVATDGRFVAFSAGNTVRVLDMETDVQRIVSRATSEPVGLSVREGRLVWGENTGSTGRILTAAA
jgi:hypothetical protein